MWLSFLVFKTQAEMVEIMVRAFFLMSILFVVEMLAGVNGLV